MKSESVSCVVCGSLDLFEERPAEIEDIRDVSFSYSFHPERNKTFRVVRCGSCSHQFCSPLPAGILGSYYDVVDEEYLKHAESRRLAARAVLHVVKSHAPAGELLDVGCATGDFLHVARESGYGVQGIELSNWSCQLARQKGFLVHQEPLASFAKQSPGRFDVVSLIGVIEHFSQPRVEMANIAALLKPSGLVVIWTGDVSSWLARVLGRKWWYWQGQHIQYFTQRSLELLAGEAGLEPVMTTRYPFAATHATLSNSLRRYSFHRLLSAALVPLFKLKPVVYLRLPGEMLFMARRRS